MSRRLRGDATPTARYAAREQRHNPTHAEDTLWAAVRDRQVAGLKFRRQHPFGPYILDLYCVERRLGIEVDGDIHDEPLQVEHDKMRSQFLDEHGIQLVRFRNVEIETDLDHVLAQIEQVARGSPLKQ